MAATVAEVRKSSSKPPIIERRAPPGKLRAMASSQFDDNPNGDMTEWLGDWPLEKRARVIKDAEEYVATHPGRTVRTFDDQGVIDYETSRL